MDQDSGLGGLGKAASVKLAFRRVANNQSEMNIIGQVPIYEALCT